MTILYFILAAIALGILVFIHELGHYFVAKKTGMTVEIFSIGFGKPFCKWRWHDVDWQLCWLPFGGYVKISGMEFGKKDPQTYNDPYTIPNGFFSKSPFKRILVALAGPFANFLLAFLIFTGIWAMGGREKSFSDYTHIVGWVDPRSALFADGLRPGDIITEYNGKPYTSPKDLLYAATLGGKEILLKGFHVDYATGQKTPFSYDVESYAPSHLVEGLMTAGVNAGASYLIYDKFPGGAPNPLFDGSPMQGSGITYKDRFVWADGNYLFSLDQLSYLLNSTKAFLKVKRGDSIIFTRQPRMLAGDLLLPLHVRNELIDWQYEWQKNAHHGRQRLQDIYILPYVISHAGYVEAPLSFIDAESKKEAFPSHPLSSLEQPLLAGDQILAVDGLAVANGYQLLERLQNRHVSLIVEKDVPLDVKLSWKEEDQVFIEEIRCHEIERVAQTIGGQYRQPGRFQLLDPIEPKPIYSFALTEEAQLKLQKQIETQRANIEKIRDKRKQQQALQILEQSQQKRILGISLQDRKVNYNPKPWAIFDSVFGETWATLKALFSGYLNPKFLSGPIGIVQVIHQGWQTGISEALFWIGAISVNLGFLNLLPIPVLDGGYVTLSLWEIITRRKLKAKMMERLIIPFVVLLIGLIIFLTFQDILRFF